MKEIYTKYREKGYGNTQRQEIRTGGRSDGVQSLSMGSGRSRRDLTQSTRHVRVYEENNKMIQYIGKWEIKDIIDDKEDKAKDERKVNTIVR